MATPDIPDDLESLSPAWLTHALQQAGTLKNAHITSLTAEPVGVGIGVIGQLFRLQLAYDRIEDGAPLSLVVKLPSADPQTRIRYWRLAKGNIYERESRFYREIAANLPLPTPHCHYSAYDYPRKKFILLLEDMAATQPGDQVAGCSYEQAELVLDHMARLHSAHWRDPRIAAMDWVPGFEFEAERLQGSFAESWPIFRERFAAQLPVGALDIGDMLLRDGLAIRYRLAYRPRTLIHSDFRLDNLFFLRDRPAIAVCDWQTYRHGPAAWDLATFLCWSLTPEQRAEGEHDLLQTYHAALTAAGTPNYCFEQLRTDYHLASLLVFFHMGRCFIYNDIDSDQRQRENAHLSIARICAAVLAHKDAR